MALWDKIRSRGNVEDRRGAPRSAMVGGIGLSGLILIVALNYLGGGDIGDVLIQLQNVQTHTSQSNPTQDFEGVDSYEVFAAQILGSNNDLWSEIFAQSGLTYTEPRLVLFREGTASGCGGAESRFGPHYCPTDRTIYLDETFFDELTARLGAEGGDVAEAYVIAHEVGHHVQSVRKSLSESRTNEASIKTELQADCYAGLWAYSIKDVGVFERGEIGEAIDAAGAVGDDRIQTRTSGEVNPETWTHGSSEQRIAAFNAGYETGSITACDG